MIILVKAGFTYYQWSGQMPVNDIFITNMPIFMDSLLWTNKHNSNFQQLLLLRKLKLSLFKALYKTDNHKCRTVRKFVIKTRAERLPCEVWKVKGFQVEKRTFLTKLLYRYSIKILLGYLQNWPRYTESNKSRKCPERDSNQGPPDCDHWVTLPPAVTELFSYFEVNLQTGSLHCSWPNCRTSATQLWCSYDVKDSSTFLNNLNILSNYNHALYLCKSLRHRRN